MPIIVPSGARGERLRTNLQAAHVDAIEEADALYRDFRPARIGLLNLMPAVVMERTEVQWMQWMGQSALQVECVLMRFDEDQRAEKGSKRAEILSSYRPFSQVAEAGLDGLIVTGDNQEVMHEADQEGFASGKKPLAQELEELHYYNNLIGVLDWAEQNVYSTIYSCLGGHCKLNFKYDLKRELDTTKPKIFGVYNHEIVEPDSPFVRNMNTSIAAPHSRWGNMPTGALVKTGILKVLALNEQIGWLLAEGPNAAGGRDLFIQGHPEYDVTNLDSEYQRDKAEGQAKPQNYYQGDDPTKPIPLTWRTDAQVLHNNWINFVYDHYSRPQALKASR